MGFEEWGIGEFGVGFNFIWKNLKIIKNNF